jgi:hypothetical protein
MIWIILGQAQSVAPGRDLNRTQRLPFYMEGAVSVFRTGYGVTKNIFYTHCCPAFTTGQAQRFRPGATG